MALITCSECGKEVSDKATACVHCGSPIAESTSKKSENLDLYEAFGGIFSAADAVSAINAYQPNQYVQFLASRRFWSPIVIYVGLIVFLFIEDGFYMASAGAAGLTPFFVPLIVSKFLYPFHHLKKYFEQNGVDNAIRNSQSSRDVAMAAYNAMPSKKMLKYIKGLNEPVGLKIEEQLAAHKEKQVPFSTEEQSGSNVQAKGLHYDY